MALAEAGAGPPRSLDVLEEWSAIRIPYGPDDADNFVLGLAIDLTCTNLPVPNPDPERGPLGPAPLLLVATSDDQLRLFSLAQQDRPGDAVAPPLPLPANPPALAAPAPAQAAVAGARDQGATQGPHVSDDAAAAAAKAAKAALLSDDEFDGSEEGSERGGRGPEHAPDSSQASTSSSQGESPATPTAAPAHAHAPGSAEAHAVAAATALPPDNDLEEGEDESEVGSAPGPGARAQGDEDESSASLGAPAAGRAPTQRVRDDDGEGGPDSDGRAPQGEGRGEAVAGQEEEEEDEVQSRRQGDSAAVPSDVRRLSEVALECRLGACLETACGVSASGHRPDTSDLLGPCAKTPLAAGRTGRMQHCQEAAWHLLVSLTWL